MAVRLDLAKPFELPDAVVHMNDKVARLQFRKIAEKARSADFVAWPLDRRGHIEKVRVAVNGEVGFAKCHTFGERRANQQHPGGFLRALRRKPGSSFLGFTEHV